MDREQRIRRKTVYTGRVVDLFVDQVRIRDHSRHIREVVGHKAAVAIVPQLDDGSVVLVRQYRYAVGRVLWELPAGLMDRGETPRRAAARELREETGYRASSWQRLTAVYSSPGFCSEIIHLYLARRLTAVGPPQLDKDESLIPVVVSRREAQRLLASGKIADAKTALGLSLVLGKG